MQRSAAGCEGCTMASHLDAEGTLHWALSSSISHAIKGRSTIFDHRTVR